MTTFIYLLIAFVVLFIISRVMNSENRIDNFAKYLGMLACGLLLGAGAQYYFNAEQPEKTEVVTTSPIPTHQVDAVVNSTNTNTVASQELIGRDIVVIESEGDLAQKERIVEIEDDS